MPDTDVLVNIIDKVIYNIQYIEHNEFNKPFLWCRRS